MQASPRALPHSTGQRARVLHLQAASERAEVDGGFVQGVRRCAGAKNDVRGMSKHTCGLYNILPPSPTVIHPKNYYYQHIKSPLGIDTRAETNQNGTRSNGPYSSLQIIRNKLIRLRSYSIKRLHLSDDTVLLVVIRTVVQKFDRDH